MLTIDPGDRVRFATLDAGWGLEPPLPDGGDRRVFEPRHGELDEGHALRRADRRDGCPCRRFRRCGSTSCGSGRTASRLPAAGTRRRTFASESRASRDTLSSGRSTPVPEPGPTSTGGSSAYGLSRACSGCRRPSPASIRRRLLGPAGGRHPTATICRWDRRSLLPIPVDEALFSAGDGHARQGTARSRASRSNARWRSWTPDDRRSRRPLARDARRGRRGPPLDRVRVRREPRPRRPRSPSTGCSRSCAGNTVSSVAMPSRSRASSPTST